MNSFDPNWNARERAMYAQGARSGHIDGQARVGQYVLGEADLASEEAARNARSDYRNRCEFMAWTAGYVDGYKLAAEGSPLPAELAEYDTHGLPEDWRDEP